MTIPAPAQRAHTLSRPVRRARLGVFGVFFVVGFLMANWLVNIPAIQTRAGITHGTLGILLLVLGLGGVIAMQVCGVLIARYGSKTVTVIAVIAAIVAINLPAWTTSAIGLGIALFLFGLGNGAADVAMNDQAVIVEQRYGRPIMSAFHAFWSIGGAVGAVWGATCQFMGLDVRLSVGAGAAIAAALAAYFLRVLLPSPPETVTGADAVAAGSPAPAGAGSVRLRMIAYGALAFLLMLAEGVANDWGPLHAVEHMDRSAASASLAYGTFAVAMTLGRLTVDRVAHRFGPRFVVRFGSLLAAFGIGVVVLSPTYSLTLLGWAIYGIGLAGIVPQLFTAAGNLPTARPSVALARVVGAGYVGMLAGPAIIGFVAGKIGLNEAFVLPLLFCLIGVALAGTVSSGRSRQQAGPNVAVDSPTLN